MCLIVPGNEVKVLVASKDVTCYKVLDMARRGPYRRLTYELGVERTGGLDEVGTLNDTKTRRPYDYMSVHQGFHSFKSREGARVEVRDWNYGMAVYRAVIPAGARYISGLFVINGKAYRSYASNALMVLELVQ